MSNAPARGDIISLNFDPQAGHEQSGRRPALVLSSEKYNKASGLCLVCPITTRKKGYPFELELKNTKTTVGVILCDQVRSLDWEVRNWEFKECCPITILNDVIARVDMLLKQ